MRKGNKKVDLDLLKAAEQMYDFIVSRSAKMNLDDATQKKEINVYNWYRVIQKAKGNETKQGN